MDHTTYFLVLLQSVLVWPVAIVLIALLFKVELRAVLKALETLVMRLRSAEALGFKGMFDQNAAASGSALVQQGSKDAGAGSTQGIAPTGIAPPDAGGPALTATKYSGQLGVLEVLAVNDPKAAEIVDELAKFISNENALNVAFGSQLELLAALQEAGLDGLILADPMPMYEKYKERGGQGTQQQWLQFLTGGRHFIERIGSTDALQYRLTDEGRNFLAHVARFYPVRPLRPY